ncbi:VWA domain-containing protein [Oceanobacillus bengalensis]|nr:VWA domain-containing protein [Oceanobacillus bengalensis]
MRRNRFVIFSLLLTLSIIVIGCGNEKESSDEEPQPSEYITEEKSHSEADNITHDETKEEDDKEMIEKDLSFLDGISPAPENGTSVIDQTQGKYADIDVRDESVNADVLENVGKLEPLPEDASDEQLDMYFNYLYSLVAEDFPDPQDIIKKWEFGSFGNPDLPDSRYHFKENYNVEILLDSSGSMGFYAGDKTRMQVAKETISTFLKNVPEDANVSLRVYGHEGTGSDSDKALSCDSIEQVYGFQSYNATDFDAALRKFEPAGWTPLAEALKQSEKALQQFDSKNNTNLIYLVSDGIETCDGNPVKVAESLVDSNAQPIINIIGFQADNEAQDQLKSMAEAANGIYSTASNQEELEAEFDRAEEVLEAWEEWKDDALDDLDAEEVDASFDILAFTNDWGQINRGQKLNVSRLTKIFRDEGIINKEQEDVFHAKKNKIEELIYDVRAELESELRDVSAQKINEMKSIINEKYNDQSKE